VVGLIASVLSGWLISWITATDMARSVFSRSAWNSRRLRRSSAWRAAACASAKLPASQVTSTAAASPRCSSSRWASVSISAERQKQRHFGQNGKPGRHPAIAQPHPAPASSIGTGCNPSPARHSATVSHRQPPISTAFCTSRPIWRPTCRPSAQRSAGRRRQPTFAPPISHSSGGVITIMPSKSPTAMPEIETVRSMRMEDMATPGAMIAPAGMINRASSTGPTIAVSPSGMGAVASKPCPCSVARRTSATASP
jgi:hypothetical protein